MNISTLARYLIGQPKAILEVAETKSAFWLGLLFVMSAGFAREYDGKDLLHEPGYLLLPLVGSLATSFMLFCMLWMASRKQVDCDVPFFRTYRMFLGLYWMMAPMAWLYALPVERWFSAAGATQANLWLLALVATWRVVLMLRVIFVLFEAKLWQAFPVMLLFADTVVVAVLKLTPIPIFEVMGGVRLTDGDAIIQGVALIVGLLGILSWPIWFIWALAIFVNFHFPRNLAVRFTSSRQVSRSAWVLAIVSLLIWIPFLWQTQPSQQLRYAVESDLHAGRIKRALETMSRHEPSDFPLYWDPPPRIGYSYQHPPILDVVDVILVNPQSPWVADVFLDKLTRTVSYQSNFFWDRLDDETFDRYLGMIEQFPEEFSFVMEDDYSGLSGQADEYSERTETQKARVRALLGEMVSETE